MRTKELLLPLVSKLMSILAFIAFVVLVSVNVGIGSYEYICSGLFFEFEF